MKGCIRNALNVASMATGLKNCSQLIFVEDDVPDQHVQEPLAAPSIGEVASSYMRQQLGQAGKWSDARKGDGAAAPPSAAVTGGAGQASVQTYKDNTTLVAQNKGKQPVDDYVRAGATFSADLVVPNSATIFRVQIFGVTEFDGN